MRVDAAAVHIREQPLAALLPRPAAARVAADQHAAHLDPRYQLHLARARVGAAGTGGDRQGLDAEHVRLVRRRRKLPLRAAGRSRKAVRALRKGAAAVQAAKHVGWFGAHCQA